MKKNEDNFLQPVISVLGLAISLISALLPLFSKNWLTLLFLNKELVQPVSFLAFMLGIVIIWQIREFPITEIGFRKFKIHLPEIVWLLVIFDIIWSFSFFLLKIIIHENVLILGLIQAFLYLLFFLFLIATFSFLFLFTRQRYVSETAKENFPYTVFETMEKNRLIKPGIEIYENNFILDENELSQMNIKTFGLVRRMKIKTTPQEEEVIEFIISSDGKELIRVLKKGK